MRNHWANKAALSMSIAVLVLISTFPLVWLTLGSVKPDTELFQYPFALIPRQPTLSHYRDLFTRGNFARYFANSALVAVPSTVAAVVVSVLAGYSLARYSFIGSKFISSVLLFMYMIPPILLVLPVYNMLVRLHLRDSLVSLAVVRTAATVPFCLWLACSYCRGIPLEFEEAAMVDGASRFQAFCKVVVPQLRPAVISLGIQSFILAWNDLLYPLILISTDSKRTVPLAIATMFGKESLYPWGVILAASVVTTVPILSLFMLGVERLVEGWGEGGIKG